jgi:phosphoglucosamine mutase
MERVPQLLRSVQLPRRLPLPDMPQLSAEHQRVEQQLRGSGRLVVRWSGTEPKLRVMLEGPNHDQLRTLCDQLVDAAQRDLA